jgi:sugar phosphate isomerase/epimerase
MAEERMAAFREAGLTVMEISDGMPGYERLNFAAARQLADKYGITLRSMHLPFAPFTQLDPSVPELADYTVDYFRGLIEQGAAIGIRIFVVHPSGEPIREHRDMRMATAKKSLVRLAEIAAAHGGVIAVENLPRTCLGKNSAEMAELISAHEALRVCFDTNHLLGQPTAEFMHDIGNKIIATHISDYDFVNERHWLPGEGKVDWQEVIAILTEIGYDGPWLYEMGLVCPKTILRDRDLRYTDLMRNARELFTGQTPTIFSRPKPNLGWWE